MRPQLTTQLLGFAGLTPFYFSLFGVAFLQEYPRALSVQGFVIYSLAILCFLSGALWGHARRLPDNDQHWHLLVSNGLVIFAVASVLTAQVVLAVLLLMLGYLALLWYERRTQETRNWYSAMRVRLTLGVVFAHLLFFGLNVVMLD
ncbi:DUF3429 domain-containing protein [Luminiphilus sp.]|nr:DUF3429 domain-containing protein [Luminiphilus sp.]